MKILGILLAVAVAAGCLLAVAALDYQPWIPWDDCRDDCRDGDDAEPADEPVVDVPALKSRPTDQPD